MQSQVSGRNALNGLKFKVCQAGCCHNQVSCAKKVGTGRKVLLESKVDHANSQTLPIDGASLKKQPNNVSKEGILLALRSVDFISTARECKSSSSGNSLFEREIDSMAPIPSLAFYPPYSFICRRVRRTHSLAQSPGLNFP